LSVRSSANAPLSGHMQIFEAEKFPNRITHNRVEVGR
jgi:hypothetical protein